MSVPAIAQQDIMYVLKRNGSPEPIDCRKITERLAKLANATFRFPRSPWVVGHADFTTAPAGAADFGRDAIVLAPLLHADCVSLAAEVAMRVFPRIATAKLDELTIELAAGRAAEHPHYQLLGGRLAVSCLHKATDDDPVRVWLRLQSDSFVHGRPAPPLSPAFLEDVYWLARNHPELFDDFVDHDRDYLIEGFGLTTLKQAYLLRLRTAGNKDGEVVERPQHLWLRMAIGLHGRDVDKVRETYDLLSLKLGIHATPTLFNLGTKCRQLASCYLLGVADDSLAGIMETLTDCAMISKGSGGIGLSVSNVRARGSAIVSTGGTSNGLVGMLRVFEKLVKYVDQGGGKRPGSLCAYLEPWHPDILDFVQLRRPTGDDETRVRGLFYGVWMCDLFMRRLATHTEWSLFCPDECPGLNTTDNEEFDALYERYEREGKARATIAPAKIWEAMLVTQMETGMPFLLYKDAVNRACNQRNLGTIRSSNLCCEVIQFTGPDEIAVCNLASLALPSMVVVPGAAAAAGGGDGGSPPIDPATGMLDRSRNYVDYALLERVAYTMVVNLNRVLDQGHAPVDQAQRSNDAHRPLGLGVQGLADVFCLLGLDFDAPEARVVNRQLFETIYFGALRASADLAERDGAYASFAECPAWRGLLQFDLVTRPRLPNAPADTPLEHTGSWVPSDDRHDWSGLKARIRRTGLRNSLVVALMPTATTSQILGFNECFEPYTSNLYTRRTLSGVFTVMNRHMVADMEALGRWTPQMYQRLLANKGSVAGIEGLPEAFRRRYRTANELSMKAVIDLAADRQAFVCQSQSMNLWMAAPSTKKLTQMHTYAWQQGLKTSVYYLHSESKLQAQQFVVAPTAPASSAVLKCVAAANEEDSVCEMCSA